MINMNQQQIVKQVNNVMAFGDLVRTKKERESDEFKELSVALYLSEKEELITAKNIIEFLDGMCDVFVTGVQLAAVNDNFSINSLMLELSVVPIKWVNIDFNTYGAMNEVNRSNLTKTPYLRYVLKEYGGTDKEACEAACKWIEEHRWQVGVTYRVVDDVEGKTRVVFYNEDGKYVKPWSFQEPSLKQFIKVKGD